MAGTIFFSDDKSWAGSSSEFNLALDALITLVLDSRSKMQLVEISEENIGMLDIEGLPERGRAEVLRYLADGRHWEAAKKMIIGGEEWVDAREKPMKELSALAVSELKASEE
ncbi:hypothetical protein O4214_05460 [Rhodococcus erythropolis]|uniref:hypothetical protein n=1 Tax=Rhodococcus erythropolis TaxID=1833 RepID=UPI00105CC3BF|nr:MULTISPECIES: hypothetical protein [Rhodococcus erythropolis group]MCD2104366.1 hypothetical protein [Rhodococcus qingshengii]MCZ4523421.1 hypothetical protein [Rhodococcus erythropolis]